MGEGQGRGRGHFIHLAINCTTNRDFAQQDNGIKISTPPLGVTPEGQPTEQTLDAPLRVLVLPVTSLVAIRLGIGTEASDLDLTPVSH